MSDERFKNCQGRLARVALTLGGSAPSRPERPPGNEVHPCREGGEKPRQLFPVANIRLIQVMRKLDPDLAHMIESLITL